MPMNDPFQVNHPQPAQAHHLPPVRDLQGAQDLPPAHHHLPEPARLPQALSNNHTAEHTLQQRDTCHMGSENPALGRLPYHQNTEEFLNARFPHAYQERLTPCPPAPSLGSPHSAAAAPSSLPAESILSTVSSMYMSRGTDVAELLMRRTITHAQDSLTPFSPSRAPTALAELRQLSLELVRGDIAGSSDSFRQVGNLWVLQWLVPILRPRGSTNFSLATDFPADAIATAAVDLPTEEPVTAIKPVKRITDESASTPKFGDSTDSVDLTTTVPVHRVLATDITARQTTVELVKDAMPSSSACSRLRTNATSPADTVQPGDSTSRNFDECGLPTVRNPAPANDRTPLHQASSENNQRILTVDCGSGGASNGGASSGGEPTGVNPSDIDTKPLSPPEFAYKVKLLGLMTKEEAQSPRCQCLDCQHWHFDYARRYSPAESDGLCAACKTHGSEPCRCTCWVPSQDSKRKIDSTSHEQTSATQRGMCQGNASRLPFAHAARADIHDPARSAPAPLQDQGSEGAQAGEAQFGGVHSGGARSGGARPGGARSGGAYTAQRPQRHIGSCAGRGRIHREYHGFIVEPDGRLRLGRCPCCKSRSTCPICRLSNPQEG